MRYQLTKISNTNSDTSTHDDFDDAIRAIRYDMRHDGLNIQYDIYYLNGRYTIEFPQYGLTFVIVKA